MNKRVGSFESFIVVIGGSNEYGELRQCELYYPKTDHFYKFSSMNIARENATACVIDNIE